MIKHTPLIRIAGGIALASGVLLLSILHIPWNTVGQPIVATDAHAADTPVLWTCSMHPQVIQEEPGVCPICHMQLTPIRSSGEPPQESRTTDGAQQPSSPGKERKIKHWWDPMMNPPYISDKPGKSPMGMDLIPVYEDAMPENAGGGITIDPVVVQNMGIRVATVTGGPLKKSIRAVGIVAEAQPNIHDVNLRVSGWIQRLYANTEGAHIKAGSPLFDLYSPELQTAVQELIGAKHSEAALQSTGRAAQKGTTTLYNLAVRKLELLGLPEKEIEALGKLSRPPELVTFRSPVTGHITEKPIVEGASVKAGEKILRIVDHSTVWLDAQVFEQQLPFIKIGQEATARIESLPLETIVGKVIFIHPHVDMMTRTATVRLSLPNPSLDIRPGMYARVMIEAELAEHAILIPQEAVIDKGDSQLIFISRSGGKFEPRKVTRGLTADGGMVQISDGLSPGEAVVVSGQFLLDSESRLQEAVQKFLDAKRQQSKPGQQAETPSAKTTSGHKQ